MKKYNRFFKTMALAVAISSLMTMTVFAASFSVNGAGELTKFETEEKTFSTPTNAKTIVRKMDSSFWGPNLTKLNIGKGTKEVGHFVFYYSYDETPNIEEVNMEDVEIIGDFSFGGLKKLKKVKTATELQEIRSAAFTNCIELKEIDLQKLVKLGNQSFEGAGLVDVTVPGTVKKVEFQAFNLMPNLEKFVAEEGVEEIEKNAVQSFKLKEVYLPASLVKIDDTAISGNKANITIYAPAGSYAEKWAKSKGFTVKAEDSSTPTQPTQPTEPTQPTKPTTVPAMDPTNYKNPEVIRATEKGLGETKNAVKIAKEYVVFDEYSGILQSGTYDVETWNADTYATWKHGNNDFLDITSNYYVKVNGVLYLANTDQGYAHKELNASLEELNEYISAGLVQMKPTFTLWKEDPANPFYIPEGRWTEKNVGEVYVGLYVEYVPSEYKYGDKRGTVTDTNIFWTKKLIKLDMSGKGTTQPTTPTIETVTALPTTSPILVNGKRVEFEAYNINGNNYFKLRDIALAVNTTSKQFGVNWDAVKNAINLTSGSGYVSVGGELAKGDGKVKTGTTTTSQIYKDGELMTISGYNINNNNYFKLRDIGKAFNIEIDWDNTTQTVVIDTTRGYTED